MNYFFFLSPNVLQRLVWPVVRPLLRFFLHFKIINKTRSWLNEEKGIIFAANHSSELDAILVPAALPFFSRHLPVFYVSRKRDFYKTSGWRQVFYGGLFFKLWGAHPAIAGARDYKRTLSAHIKIIEHGSSVLIFPTGKKFLGDLKDAEAHGGVTFLSYATGCPIVPLRIDGVANLTFLDFIMRRRKINISFGEPILFRGHPRVSYKNDAKKVFAEIASL